MQFDCSNRTSAGLYLVIRTFRKLITDDILKSRIKTDC